MLLLTLLLPPLIISLPQSLSKLSTVPSHLKSALSHFRSPTPPNPISSILPPEGLTPDLTPPSEAVEDPLPPEPLKPEYAPLLFAGRDAWRSFRADAEAVWKKGEKEVVWFFWFSGVEVDREGDAGAPLVEGTEWPEISVEGEGEGGDKQKEKDAKFEIRRRKLEIGMFSGDMNDQVYWDTAISISKHQQQEEFEQLQAAHSSASLTSTSTKTSSVDPIIFSSESPIVPPSSHANFAFVNCNDEEERPLCYRFLAIQQHRPMLYVVTRNTTIVEPTPEPVKEVEPEVAPLVPEFVHTETQEHDFGMAQQLGDDAVSHVDIEEEKAMNDDPVMEETANVEPPQPTIIHKLVLRKVPLRDYNLTTMDLQNFYKFKHWEKLAAWDDVLNPADGMVGTAMEGKVGEIIGIGYEYWYKTPKWAFGMALGLLLHWITVSVLNRAHRKREEKKAAKRRAAEELGTVGAAATSAADVPQLPLKTQVILPEEPDQPEIPVESHVPEELKVVEHDALDKAEEVASIAEVLDKAEEAEEAKHEVRDDLKEMAKAERNGEANGELKVQLNGDIQGSKLEDKISMEDL